MFQKQRKENMNPLLQLETAQTYISIYNEQQADANGVSVLDNILVDPTKA